MSHLSDRVLPDVNEVLKRAQQTSLISAATSQVDVLLREQSEDYLPI